MSIHFEDFKPYHETVRSSQNRESLTATPRLLLLVVAYSIYGITLQTKIYTLKVLGTLLNCKVNVT